MKTIDEIIKAVRALNSDQFLRLRLRLDRLEKKIWEAELEKTTRKLKRTGLTEKRNDAMVTRRRP